MSETRWRKEVLFCEKPIPCSARFGVVAWGCGGTKVVACSLIWSRDCTEGGFFTIGEGSGSGNFGVYVRGWRMYSGPSSIPVVVPSCFSSSFFSSLGGDLGVP